VHSLYPDIEVHLSGMVPMNATFSESSQGDLKSLIPISFGVMLVVLGLLLRSVAGVLATVLVIVMSIVAGIGVAGHLGYPITPPSATSPNLILTIAIASSVHVLVTFYHELRQGRGRKRAIAESLRVNLQPVFLTSLTTTIGFLSLNFSDVPPFRHMANTVAAGVIASFILSVTFLPALMTLLPRRSGQGEDPGHALMLQLGEFVVRQRTRLLAGSGALVLLLIAFVPLNELNDVYVRYFDDSVDFRHATDELDRHLGGLYRIDYSLSTGESNGISDPQFLREAEAFSDWLHTQPEVVQVTTLTDTFKRLNKNLHGDDPSWHRLPGQRELAAQYLLLYEMSLPYGLDLNNQIDVDKSATRISVAMHVLSTKQILALERRAGEWLGANAPHLLTEGASPTLMFAHIGYRNIRSMLVGTTLALVLISLILVVALRSVKIGMISMIPNLVPAAMGFGIWGIMVGEVGLSLSIVTGMTLGIVVDDTVHFLSKYLRAHREEGLDAEGAVRYAFDRVGMALFITTLVLMAGFLVLALSSFYLNSGMGLLTAIVLGLALLADFLFLPPLLIWVEERIGSGASELATVLPKS
jgi:predicted RND superfamily exporter protein